MDSHDVLSLEKAINGLSEPTPFDWLTLVLSIFAIFFAVRIPQKIANRQDRIALFEKRYDIYKIIQELCHMSFVMGKNNSPKDVISHLIFFYRGEDTIEDYCHGNGKYDNGDGTSVLYNIERDIENSYSTIQDSVLFLFNKDIYEDYSQILACFKQIIDFLNFFYYEQVTSGQISHEDVDYDKMKKKSTSVEKFQENLLLFSTKTEQGNDFHKQLSSYLSLSKL